MRKEDSDYGNLPRSKKYLIYLLRSSLMDNEVGDILAYNKELNNDAILWHHSDIPDHLFLSGFSFTNIHNSQGNKGRGRLSL